MLLTAALFLPAALLADPPVRAPEGPTARVDDGSPPRDIVPIVLLRRSAKKAPDGSGADVLVPADFSKDDIARRVRDLMSRPSSFSQVVLRLDRYVKRYLLADPGLPAEQRAALEQPAYLFLSDRQGGFPLEHFWLEGSDGGLKEMRNVPFVDMVVDEHDLEPGAIDGLEQIYAHELGHLMMAALAGPAPRKASSAMHFMTVRTDPWYAFTEGFGEHFQPVALDHYGDQVPAARRNPPASDLERFWQPRFAREQVEGCWICPANLRFVWWHGGGEQRMRDAPLRENLFVHQVTLPEPLQGDGRPASEVRMYRDVIAPSPGGPLKNASQMLSSEAVIASLFYRLVSDGRLRDSHREPSFYRPFLGTEQPASLAPGENVYLKLFDVLHHGFEWNDAPAISFVSAWASRFPEDAPALYDVFLGVTGGITVERGAAGAPGDAGYLAGLRDRVLAGTARLDGNLGRPLWLVSPGMTFGMGLYRYVPLPQNFTLDLNAADVADLRAVPGVSSALATAIVRERDARGAFASVADLSAIPGMTPELVGKFEAGFNRMEDRFRRARRAHRKAIVQPDVDDELPGVHGKGSLLRGGCVAGGPGARRGRHRLPLGRVAREADRGPAPGPAGRQAPAVAPRPWRSDPGGGGRGPAACRQRDPVLLRVLPDAGQNGGGRLGARLRGLVDHGCAAHRRSAAADARALARRRARRRIGHHRGDVLGEVDGSRLRVQGSITRDGRDGTLNCERERSTVGESRDPPRDRVLHPGVHRLLRTPGRRPLPHLQRVIPVVDHEQFRRRAPGRQVRAKVLGRPKDIARALHEEGRHADGRPVGHPKLLRPAGRMKRVADEHEPRKERRAVRSGRHL